MDADRPVSSLAPAPAVRAGAPFPAALWLLRHGESEGNVASAAAHRAGAARLELALRDADVPLTPRGRRQAEAVGRWIADLPEAERPTAVITSPYRRAVETTEGVLRASGLRVPVSSDERLRERDLGVLDGLTGRGVREDLPAEAERRRRVGKMWYRPSGGESWADVALRVRSAVGLTLPQHDGERLLLVAHQAVIMSFRIVLEGLDEATALEVDAITPQANCAVTRYARTPAGVVLEAYADTTAVDRSAEAVTEEPDADVATPA
ncbi:histidine phosphatase family protein [Quadrisphaera sp. DSM 44207]|uniref:histidine phosphatase family protein n=1 Tax=Quadrisphaera sp. DSM 44207 TaxID=1881057 RepID=UPI0008893099|nr:histidine phosphatase family protein [Quadrisphaera sp. DSM 44207]SDQ85937.1 Broad specificity phosphatase PhoE [Quadrisphaera sp. DSM 44207]